MPIGSVTTSKPKVYDSLGRCIYGSGPDHDENLTREHIIPIGLGGGFVFLGASCGKCQKITNAFETACQRKMLLPHRLHIGWVRHLDDLPKRIPMLVNKDVATPIRYVAPCEHPPMLVLPAFLQPPGILIGKAPDAVLQIVYQLLEPRGANYVPAPPGTRVALSFENVAFVRMLAKIAHSFAVAEFGLDGFDPELPDLMFGRNLALASYLIGLSTEDLPVPNDPMHSHQLGWGTYTWGDQSLLGIRIRLFSRFGTPAYTVIAGIITEAGRKRHALA